MSLNSSVITGKCPRCAELKSQVARLEAKLEAVQEYGEKLAKGHVSGTWQALVAADLDHILKGGD